MVMLFSPIVNSQYLITDIFHNFASQGAIQDKHWTTEDLCQGIVEARIQVDSVLTQWNWKELGFML